MFIIPFLILGFSSCFYLKHIVEDKYLSLSPEPKLTYLKLAQSPSDAVELDLKHLKDGIVFLNLANEENKTFDIADYDKLNMYAYHGGANQQFKIVMTIPNMVTLVNGDRCLEYLPSTEYFHLKACYFSGNQLFKVVDKKDLLSIGSGLEQRSYMSKSSTQDNIINQDFQDGDFEESHKQRKPLKKRGKKHYRHFHYIH